jgi:drug/metabolite transporter (DMT)-like permease
MNKRLGYLAIMASSFCFGFLGFFGKVGYELGYTPLSLLTVRFALATGMLWALALVRGTSLYKVPLGTMPILVTQGVSYAGTALGFFYALSYWSASLAAIVFYLHPVLTITVATFLFKERFTRSKGAAVLLAVLGTALISSPGSGAAGFHPLGFLWITFGAASYSLFTLIGQRTTRGMDSLTVTTYSITFCALTLVLLNPPLYMFNGSLTLPMWAVGLGVSFVSSVLAILLYVVGIKAIGAAKTSVASALEPLSAVLLASLLLGEKLLGLQWAGMALILLAVMALQFDHPVEQPVQEIGASATK